MKKPDIYSVESYEELGLKTFSDFKDKWKPKITPMVDWEGLTKAVEMFGSYQKVYCIETDEKFLKTCHIPVCKAGHYGHKTMFYSERFRVGELLKAIKKSPELKKDWLSCENLPFNKSVRLTVPAVWTGEIMMILDGTHRIMGVIQNKELYSKTKICIEYLDLTTNFPNPEMYFVDLLYYIHNKR